VSERGVPMPEFKDRFTKLMGLIEVIGLPKPQLEHIKHHPNFNPPLFPQPQDWWKKSFDWFIAVELMPGVEYGPFYILHGDWFWPQIGTPEVIDSEKNCFFGLEKPDNVDDAKTRYNLSGPNLINPMTYLYEFNFNIDTGFSCCIPLVFIGPVKDGSGFQMNPNSLACSAIRIAIVQPKNGQKQKNIGRYRVIDKEGKKIFDKNREEYP
jgi:hypothetical protein